jgi:hypothetical protein
MTESSINREGRDSKEACFLENRGKRFCGFWKEPESANSKRSVSFGRWELRSSAAARPH